MVRSSTKQFWHGFVSGQRIRMLVETRGTTADDEEITYSAGTVAIVAGLCNFGDFQGEGVDVVIGDGDRTICNSFDDRDVETLRRVPFTTV